MATILDKVGHLETLPIDLLYAHVDASFIFNHLETMKGRSKLLLGNRVAQKSWFRGLRCSGTETGLRNLFSGTWFDDGDELDSDGTYFCDDAVQVAVFCSTRSGPDAISVSRTRSAPSRERRT